MVRRSVLGLVVLLLFFVTDLRAQWVAIGQFDAPVTALYFLTDFGSPTTGFCGLSNGEVWKTGDGGSTWIQTTISASGPISSFTFKNLSEGWLSTRQDAAASNVYSTVDAGSTWKGLPLTRERPCVFYNTATNLLFATSLTLNSVVSSDGGASWNVFAQPGLNSIDFSGPRFGVLTPYSGFTLVTQDGGFTWNKTTMGAESWKPLAVVRNNNKYFAFAISEANRMVYRTSDGGSTWRTLSMLPAKPTGDIEGDCSQLYAQSDSGVFVSADEGVSWTALGGPGNQSDTRFVVINQTIFAGDLHGGLFRFNDQARPFTGRVGIETSVGSAQIISNGCLPDTSHFRIFANSVCLSTDLDSVVISHTQNIRVGVLQTLPKNLELDSSFAFNVVYQPNGGVYDTLRMHVYFRVSGAVFDTVLVLQAQSQPQLQLATDVQSVDLQARFTCETVNGKLTLFNGKCDSLTVDSVICDDSAHFSATLSRLPFGMPPRGSAQVTVSGHGESRGTLTTMLTLYLRVRNKHFTYTLPVSLFIAGDGKVETDILPTNVTFSPTSVCAKRDNVFYISNPACLAYQLVDVRWKNPTTSFQIISQPTLPRTLLSGQIDSVVVRFSPQQIGIASAAIIVTFIADSVQHDTIINISGQAYTQSKARLSETLGTFDTISACELTDLVAYVRNESCDSTEIVEVIAPNDVAYQLLSPQPPIWLGPGDSVPVHVKLDPASRASASGGHFDSVEIRLRNKGGSEQALDLELKAYVLPAIRRALLSSTGIIDSSFTPCSEKDTTFVLKNVGRCDTISIKTLNITGSNWFSTSTFPGLPLTLLPGDSIVVDLHTNAAPSSSTKGTLRITGDGFDTSIALVAYVHAPTGLGLAATYRDTNFVAKRCADHAGYVRYQNLTCGILTIDSAWIVDVFGNASKFALTGLQLPSTLRPGDTIDFPITFSSDALGDSSASLHLRTLEGRSADTVLLQGHITGARGTATLFPRSSSGANNWKADVGTITNVELAMQDVVPDTAALTDIHVRLSFDGDVLTPTPNKAVGLNGWTIASQTASTNTLDLNLTRAIAATVSANESVVSIPFYCTLGDALSSSVTVQDLTLNNDDSNYKRCILAALPTADSVLIAINPFCGDSLMLHVILKQSVLGDLRVIPNPVIGVRGVLEIDYQLLRSADVDLRLIDNLGKEQGHWSLPADGIGLHRSMLNISRIPRGIYYVQIRAAGERTVRKLAVE